MAAIAEKTEPRERLTPEQDRIESFFDGVNPGDRILLHKAVVDPVTKGLKYAFVYVIDSFEGMADLEAEISKLAELRKWGGGEYRATLRRPGKNGNVRIANIHILASEPESPETPSAPVPGANPLDLIRQAKELLPTNGGASPDALLGALTGAMKAGSELSRPTSGGDSLTTELLRTLITKLMERPAAPDPIELMDRMLNRLEKFGLMKPNAEGATNGLAGQLAELRQVLDLVSNFGGGGPSDVPSTFVQVAQLLAPQLPQIVGQITGMFNNAIDYGRMRLTAQVGGPLPLRQGAPAVPPPNPAMQAFITRVREAVTANDHGFFPELLATIATQVPGGGDFMQNIRAGKLDEEPALTIIGASGLVTITDPATRAYVFTFVHWIRSEQAGHVLADLMPPLPAAPPIPGAGIPTTLAAKCERCGMGYDYPNRAEYEADSRMCNEAGQDGEVCGGTIALVQDTGAA